MLHTTTPFKIIHDENDYASTVKTGKSKGLKSSVKAPIGGKISFENTPTALNKTSQNLVKTGQRRALSSLSTSQVNARINTPGAGLAKSSAHLSFNGENTVLFQTEKKQKKALESKVTFAHSVQTERDYSYLPTLVSIIIYNFNNVFIFFYKDEMKCSRSTAELDPYDEMLLKARTQRLSIDPITTKGSQTVSSRLIVLDNLNT